MTRRQRAIHALEVTPGPQRQQALKTYYAEEGYDLKAHRTLIYTAICSMKPSEMQLLAQDLAPLIGLEPIRTLCKESLHGSGGDPKKALKSLEARATAHTLENHVRFIELEEAWREALKGSALDQLVFAWEHGSFMQWLEQAAAVVQAELGCFHKERPAVGAYHLVEAYAKRGFVPKGQSEVALRSLAALIDLPESYSELTESIERRPSMIRFVEDGAPYVVLSAPEREALPRELLEV